MVDQSSAPELVKVLLELSIDPKKVEAFRRDPEGYLTQSGVSPEVRQLFMAGRQSVEAGARGRLGDTAVVVIILVIILV
jgi:hypothetical protein